MKAHTCGRLGESAPKNVVQKALSSCFFSWKKWEGSFLSSVAICKHVCMKIKLVNVKNTVTVPRLRLSDSGVPKLDMFKHIFIHYFPVVLVASRFDIQLS